MSQLTVPEILEQPFRFPLNFQFDPRRTYGARGTHPPNVRSRAWVGSQLNADGLPAYPTHQTIPVKTVITGSSKNIQLPMHLWSTH